MTTFELREMRSEDSLALERLIESAPRGQQGLNLITRFLVDPYLAWHILRPNMIGVVAEVVETGKLVGMATVSIDRYRIEGRDQDVAFLGNLKVHHDYRERGIATRLATWRVEMARQHCGQDLAIISGTTSDNVASQAVMKKWNTEFVGPLWGIPHTMATEPPPTVPGIEVRPLLESDLPLAAIQAEDFYSGYSLHPVYSPQLLRQLLTTTPKVYYYRVAVDINGNLLAGALISNRAALMVEEFSGLRPEMLNSPLIPPDGILRTAELGMFWYTNVTAARYLWQSIRWEFRGLANTITTVFDPRSTLNEIFQITPDHAPRFELMVSVACPTRLGHKPIALAVRN